MQILPSGLKQCISKRQPKKFKRKQITIILLLSQPSNLLSDIFGCEQQCIDVIDLQGLIIFCCIFPGLSSEEKFQFNKQGMEEEICNITRRWRTCLLSKFTCKSAVWVFFFCSQLLPQAEK